MKLNQEEVLRYSRHLIMPEVGVKGQEKLRDAKILLVGTGGLGARLYAGGPGAAAGTTRRSSTAPTCCPATGSTGRRWLSSPPARRWSSPAGGRN